MKMRLTQSQMLSLWRLHRLLEPIRNDAEITRRDGIDLDAILITEIERWYIELLKNAPPELLVSHNIADEIIVSSRNDGCMVIKLPPDVVRILSVRLSGWRAGVPPVRPCAIEALRQLHPYTRATPSSPVAVMCGDELRLYPAAPDSQIVELYCVRYVEGEYEFMREALASVSPLDADEISHLNFKSVQ